MEYIKDIGINEAIIHVLDHNADEPILNEYKLELSDGVYKFLYKHVDRILKNEKLKYAKFNKDAKVVKNTTQLYFEGGNDLIELSKSLAKRMFRIMESTLNIPTCDLIILSLYTEHGPMVGILKMDYASNYNHRIDFVDQKVGINIIHETTLPGTILKKAAFIKPIGTNKEFDLMVLDLEKNKIDDNSDTWFSNDFLECKLVNNERDMTRRFLNATEKWIRLSVIGNAEKAETFRRIIKENLKLDEVDINQLAEDLFKDNYEMQQDFLEYMDIKEIDNLIKVDHNYIAKKFNLKKLKLDSEISLNITPDAYKDINRFEVIKNGDGSINLLVKNIYNYIEK